MLKWASPAAVKSFGFTHSAFNTARASELPWCSSLAGFILYSQTKPTVLGDLGVLTYRVAGSGVLSERSCGISGDMKHQDNTSWPCQQNNNGGFLIFDHFAADKAQNLFAFKLV